jgi:hypothetical protein
MGAITKADGAATRAVLDRYETSVKRDLNRLDDTFRGLAELPYLKVFGLDDEMLDVATSLALAGVVAKPFDHAILAAVLVRASRLWDAGERGIAFCEADADLQPWDRYGNAKQPLLAAYDTAHVWVYEDFMLAQPVRRADFD